MTATALEIPPHSQYRRGALRLLLRAPMGRRAHAQHVLLLLPALLASSVHRLPGPVRLRGGDAGDAGRIPPEVTQIEQSVLAAAAEDAASLRCCIAGDFDAHPLGASIRALDLHFRRVAGELEDAAVAAVRRGDIEGAGRQLRSAAEASVRGACRLNLLLLSAIGAGLGQRWLVYAWALIENAAHARGHRALSLAAAACPEHAELTAEAAKRSAYAAAAVPPGADADAIDAGDRLRAFEVPVERARDAALCCARFGGERELIVQTRRRVLSREECAAAVERAEEHAAAGGGWSSSRHVAYSTTDLPLHEVCTLLPWFNEAMRTTLLPLVASAAGFGRLLRPLGGACALRVHDAFLVKYEAGEAPAEAEGEAPRGAAAQSEPQSELHAHQDQSLISFTVGLNEADEYGGGGTHFECLGATLGSGAGHFTAFAGGLTHAGAPITWGRRYILVLFCYAEGWNSCGPPSDDEPLAFEWARRADGSLL